MMWQWIIVGLVLLFAVIYLVKRFFRRFTRSTQECNCDGSKGGDCAHCPFAKDDKYTPKS